MKTLPQARPAATHNGEGPPCRDAAAVLMELIEAEMQRLPPGPRNELRHNLAALAERGLDEASCRRDTPDVGSSMSTNPDAGLPSDLKGMYYLG